MGLMLIHFFLNFSTSHQYSSVETRDVFDGYRQTIEWDLELKTDSVFVLKYSSTNTRDSKQEKRSITGKWSFGGYGFKLVSNDAKPEKAWYTCDGEEIKRIEFNIHFPPKMKAVINPLPCVTE